MHCNFEGSGKLGGTNAVLQLGSVIRGGGEVFKILGGGGIGDVRPAGGIGRV